MSINLQKRITTGPTTAFVSCVNLPKQERDITMQEARMITGGGEGPDPDSVPGPCFPTDPQDPPDTPAEPPPPPTDKSGSESEDTSEISILWGLIEINW